MYFLSSLHRNLEVGAGVSDFRSCTFWPFHSTASIIYRYGQTVLLFIYFFSVSLIVPLLMRISLVIKSKDGKI